MKIHSRLNTNSFSDFLGSEDLIDHQNNLEYLNRTRADITKKTLAKADNWDKLKAELADLNKRWHKIK